MVPEFWPAFWPKFWPKFWPAFWPAFWPIDSNASPPCRTNAAAQAQLGRGPDGSTCVQCCQQDQRL